MEDYLKVTITRNYGNGNLVTIEATNGKVVKTDEGTVEFDLMVDQLNRYFDHFSMVHLPHMRFSAPDDEDIKLMAPTKLEIMLDKGKRYVKVMFPPPYDQYGVQWWPEDMKAAGINPKSIPEEGYTPKVGSMAEVLFRNGKPKKVIRIIAPQEPTK